MNPSCEGSKFPEQKIEKAEKLEKVRGSSRKSEKLREAWRKLEKVGDGREDGEGREGV